MIVLLIKGSKGMRRATYLRIVNAVWGEVVKCCAEGSCSEAWMYARRWNEALPANNRMDRIWTLHGKECRTRWSVESLERLGNIQPYKGSPLKRLSLVCTARVCHSNSSLVAHPYGLL